LAGIAVNRLNLSVNEFLSLTPRVFDYALRDYAKLKEERERFELEKMRLQTWVLYNTQIKDPIRDIRKFMPFEWDKIEAYMPTNEEWQKYDELIKKLKKANGRQNN